MRRAALSALALAAAGGAAACDDAIALRLRAPPGETTTAIDYGCVTHVEVTAIGEDPTDKLASCLPVDAGAIRSLRDHDLSGLVALALPRTGLRRVVVRGVRSFDQACNSPGAATVFQGQGEYGGGWELDVPLQHSLDCAAYVSTPTPVRVLDLHQLVTGTTPAARCQPPAGIDQYAMSLWLGYARGYGTGLEAAAFEEVSEETAIAADGTGTIPGPHFVHAETPSCLQIYANTGPLDGTIYAATCVDDRLPTACSAAGTVEAVVYETAVWTQAFNVTGRPVDYPTGLTLGLVWDPVAGTPIAGATAERRDGRTNLGQAYLAYDAGTVTAATGATPASGLFAFQGDAPMTVLVSAPNYQSRVVVLDPSFNNNAVSIVPLARR